MRHWIFDLDGTLFETEVFFIDCLSYALKPFDIEASWAFLEEVRSQHPYSIFDRVLGPQDAKVAMGRLIEAGREMIPKVNPYGGIIEMLEGLKEKSESIHIWTGRDKASAQRILRSTGCDQYFDSIVTGTCVSNNKPSPDGLLKISEATKISLNNFVMVGDHHHDITPAKKMGCLTVHARWKSHPHQLEKPYESHKAFAKVSDFVSWIHSKS